MAFLLLPIIVLGISAVAGITGLAAGCEGLSDMDKARETALSAERLHKSALKKLEISREKINSEAESFFNYKKDIKINTFAKLADYLEVINRRNHNYRNGKYRASTGISEIRITHKVNEYRQQSVDAISMIGKGISSLVAGTGSGAASLPQHHIVVLQVLAQLLQV